VAYDAVIAGHICLDIYPDLSKCDPEVFARAFLPGRLLVVGPLAFSTGGPVSNTGLSLAKLGIETRFMGKVGDDLLGRAVRDIVAAFGPQLADGMIVDGTVDTSYSIVISPPGVDRIIFHCPGANDTFGADDVEHKLVSQARLFHFGYPPVMRSMYENDGAELAKVFQQAKETGVTTSLDMALPDPSSAAGRADWVAILRSTLPSVDVFLPSIEETLYMLRRVIYDELYEAAGGPNFLPLITPELLSDLSQELLGMGTRIVVLKLGDRGLYVRSADSSAIKALGRAQPSDPTAWGSRELWTACFEVDVAGTAGAGDATIAGFLSALLRDLSPEEAATAAVAVGACNVEAVDTLSGVRSWEATMRRVASGWARRELHLEAPSWRFDEAHQLWVADTSYGCHTPRAGKSRWR
jgi:sugar/nucleoside kinase (ribokinase family)